MEIIRRYLQYKYYQVVLEEAPEFNVEKIYRKILEGR